MTKGEGSGISGSETVGVEEGMAQKLWRDDCRCGDGGLWMV